jgi:hypothetical protein
MNETNKKRKKTVLPPLVVTSRRMQSVTNFFIGKYSSNFLYTVKKRREIDGRKPHV